MSQTAGVIRCRGHLKKKNETFYYNRISDNLVISFSSENVNASIQAGFVVHNRLLYVNNVMSLTVNIMGSTVASKMYAHAARGNFCCLDVP